MLSVFPHHTARNFEVRVPPVQAAHKLEVGSISLGGSGIRKGSPWAAAVGVGACPPQRGPLSRFEPKTPPAARTERRITGAADTRRRNECERRPAARCTMHTRSGIRRALRGAGNGVSRTQRRFGSAVASQLAESVDRRTLRQVVLTGVLTGVLPLSAARRGRPRRRAVQDSPPSRALRRVSLALRCCRAHSVGCRRSMRTERRVGVASRRIARATTAHALRCSLGARWRAEEGYW